MTAPDIVLTADELRTVTEVLASLGPQHQAMVFGSRVRTGTTGATLKAHADLDIALMGPPLAPHDMFLLRDAFSESDLPFRVDISMRDELPPQWRDSVTWAALRPWPLPPRTATQAACRFEILSAQPQAKP